jgi:hypothetical protein
MIEGVRFVPDSPLEGDGFEPSVPREREAERKRKGVGRVEPGSPAKHPLVRRHRIQPRRVRHGLERLSFSDTVTDPR